MFSQTTLGAALSSSTLLCLRSSFRPPAAGLGLPGGVILRAVLTRAGGVVLPGLLWSRREVDLLSGGRARWMLLLLLSSQRDNDLRTGLFSRFVVAAEAVVAAVLSPGEIVREGDRLGTTRFMCLRRARSFVPVGRALSNHLAPRCRRPHPSGPVSGEGINKNKAAAKIRRCCSTSVRRSVFGAQNQVGNHKVCTVAAAGDGFASSRIKTRSLAAAFRARQHQQHFARIPCRIFLKVTQETAVHLGAHFVGVTYLSADHINKPLHAPPAKPMSRRRKPGNNTGAGSQTHPLRLVGVHHAVQLCRRPTAVELGRDDARRRLGPGFGEVLPLFLLKGEVEPTQGLPLLVEGELRRLLAVRPQVESGKSGIETKGEGERQDRQREVKMQRGRER